MTTLQLSTPDGLTIRFTKSGDRFVHHVSIDGRCVWRSIGGTDDDPDADDNWPASPPIQELSLQSLPGGDVLLGVGAAGRSHWSLSVQRVPATTQPGGQLLRLDWACRTSAGDADLGTCYGPAAAGAATDTADAAALSWVCEAGTIRQDQTAGRFRLSPTDTAGKTRQWSYRIGRIG